VGLITGKCLKGNGDESESDLLVVMIFLSRVRRDVDDPALERRRHRKEDK
jgi:hypothetical protein